MRKIITMLIAGIILAACGNTLEGAKKDLGGGSPSAQINAPASPPAATTPAPTAVQQRGAQSMVGDFPTSMQTAQGSDWNNIHDDSFKGDVAQACAVIKLSESECARWQAMRDSGQCTETKLPNGVVLDYLGYSKPQPIGTRAQHRVKVSLKKEDRDPGVLLCNLGDKYVGTVYRCGNPIRIDVRPAPIAQSPLVQQAPAGCPAELPLYTHVWSMRTLPADIRLRINEKASRAQVRVRHDQSDDISRSLGGELRCRAGAGEFARSSLPVTVRMSLLSERSENLTFVGENTFVSGMHVQNFTRPQIQGKVIQTIVSAAGGVVSPTVWQGNGLHDLRIFPPEWGPECSKNQHIILP